MGLKRVFFLSGKGGGKEKGWLGFCWLGDRDEVLGDICSE